MAEQSRQRAIGDGGSTHDSDTDPNGARTAVGVSHPENRPDGQKLPAVDLSHFELDDYDDDKQARPTAVNLPAVQDAGESFREIVDVGEASGVRDHNQRDNEDMRSDMTPTVDNQLNQPERFQNRRHAGIEPAAE